MTVRRIDAAALLVRAVPYGESDLIVTFVTETDGKVAAIVRGGRKPSRRIGGALEPFHTVRVALDDRGADLAALREASIERVRAGLVTRLEAVEAGGAALRWARHLFPPRTPEPDGWAALVGLLDALDAGADAELELAAAGVALLAAVGYALDLERCVRCGRPCPDGRPAAVDAARGGLMCQACGGARRVVGPATRALARALGAGERPSASDPEAVREVRALVEEAMAAHTDYGG